MELYRARLSVNHTLKMYFLLVTVKLDTVLEESTTDEEKLTERNQYTFSPNFSKQGVSMEQMASSINKNLLDIKP